MIDLNLLRDMPDFVREAIARKKFDCDLDAVLALDEERRSCIARSEKARADQNSANKEMAAMEKGSPEFLEKVDALATGRGRVPYHQPLTPSEYMTRQVRVAALATTDNVTPLLAQVPPEILAYSSDYPHPEGGEAPFATFDEQLRYR